MRSIPSAFSSSFTFSPSSAAFFCCCTSANWRSSFSLFSFSRCNLSAVLSWVLSSPLLPLSALLSCCLTCHRCSASRFSSISLRFSCSKRCFRSWNEQPFPSCDTSCIFNADKSGGASAPLFLIFLYSFSRLIKRCFSFAICSLWFFSSVWSRRRSSSACLSVSCCWACSSWTRLCSSSSFLRSSSRSFSNCSRMSSFSRSSCWPASRCFCSNSSRRSCSVSKNSNSICRSRSILSCFEIMLSSISFMACACCSSSSTSLFFSDSIICFSCSCSLAAFSSISKRSFSSLFNRSRSSWSLTFSSSLSLSSRSLSSSIVLRASCCCCSNNCILSFSFSIFEFSFSLSSFSIFICALSSSSSCLITSLCLSFICSSFLRSSSISSLSSCWRSYVSISSSRLFISWRASCCLNSSMATLSFSVPSSPSSFAFMALSLSYSSCRLQNNNNTVMSWLTCKISETTLETFKSYTLSPLVQAIIFLAYSQSFCCTKLVILLESSINFQIQIIGHWNGDARHYFKTWMCCGRFVKQLHRSKKKQCLL